MASKKQFKGLGIGKEDRNVYNKSGAPEFGKFGTVVKLDPLEREQQMKTLHPDPGYKKKKRMKKLAQEINMIRTRNVILDLPPEVTRLLDGPDFNATREQLCFILAQEMNQVEEDKIDNEFVRDFVLWLQGTSHDPEVIAKSWWWWDKNKIPSRNKTAVNMDECKDVKYRRLVGKDIVNYLDVMVDKKMEFEKKMTILSNFIPQGLEQAWNYWKYVIKGLDTLESDYMDYFSEILPFWKNPPARDPKKPVVPDPEEERLSKQDKYIQREEAQPNPRENPSELLPDSEFESNVEAVAAHIPEETSPIIGKDDVEMKEIEQRNEELLSKFEKSHLETTTNLRKQMALMETMAKKEGLRAESEEIFKQEISRLGDVIQEEVELNKMHDIAQELQSQQIQLNNANRLIESLTSHQKLLKKETSGRLDLVIKNLEALSTKELPNEEIEALKTELREKEKKFGEKKLSYTREIKNTRARITELTNHAIQQEKLIEDLRNRLKEEGESAKKFVDLDQKYQTLMKEGQNIAAQLKQSLEERSKHQQSLLTQNQRIIDLEREKKEYEHAITLLNEGLAGSGEQATKYAKVAKEKEEEIKKLRDEAAQKAIETEQAKAYIQTANREEYGILHQQFRDLVQENENLKSQLTDVMNNQRALQEFVIQPGKFSNRKRFRTEERVWPEFSSEILPEAPNISPESASVIPEGLISKIQENELQIQGIRNNELFQGKNMMEDVESKDPSVARWVIENHLHEAAREIEEHPDEKENFDAEEVKEVRRYANEKDLNGKTTRKLERKIQEMANSGNQRLMELYEKELEGTIYFHDKSAYLRQNNEKAAKTDEQFSQWPIIARDVLLAEKYSENPPPSLTTPSRLVEMSKSVLYRKAANGLENGEFPLKLWSQVLQEVNPETGEQAISQFYSERKKRDIYRYTRRTFPKRISSATSYLNL